jgi:tetratricopeptide (TPR) repeat protein/predicted Ser/Thr protein kinase
VAQETPSSIGPYTILGELGRGGMGVVYRARRADLDREFALKVILEDRAAEGHAAQRFEREARAAAQLADHPGIVGCRDIGEAEGRLYFAMDLVEGESLEELVADGDLTPRQSAAILEQAARAVHHAHLNGVLHRDVKPGNILVTTGERALVTDFGLAAVQETDPEVSRLTHSGVLLGTPAYMAPEQAQGRSVDARADVWSLGATLYEALSGDTPVPAGSLGEMMITLLRRELEPLRRRAPGVPADLATIADHCLQREPARRYPTAEALADDLARYLRGDAIVARPPGPAERAGRWLRRHRLSVGAVAAVTLLGGGALALRGALTERSERTTENITQVGEKVTELDRSRADSLAFHALIQRSLDDVLVIEDRWWQRAADPAAVAAEVARVEAIAAEVARETGATHVTQAWVATARGLSGDEAAGRELSALADTSEAGPIVRMLQVRWLLTQYARWMGLPTIQVRSVGTDGIYLAESDDQSAWIAEALELLRRTEREGWGGYTQAEELRAFAVAGRAFAGQDHARACALLEPLIEDPFVGAAAARMLGAAAFALGEYDRAARAWLVAGRRGRTHPLRDGAAACVAAAVAAEDVGKDGRPNFRRAVEVYDSLAEIAPGMSNLAHDRVTAIQMLVQAMRMRGEDPSAVVQKGLAVLDAVPDPEPWTYRQRVRLHLARARWGREQGQDPRPTLRAAVEAAERGLEVTDSPVEDRVLLGRTLRELAEVVAMAGGDPGPELDRGVSVMNEAVALDGRDRHALMERGRLHVELARWKRSRGQPARPALSAAMADFDAACGDGASLADLTSVADALMQVAQTGGDPRPPLFKAREIYTRLIAAGDQAFLYFNRANVYLTLSRVTGDAAINPEEQLRLALADLNEALKRDPQLTRALANRAIAHAKLAAVLAARGEDATKAYAAALADFDAAWRANPRNWMAAANKATLLIRMGRSAEALQAVDAALEQTPDVPQLQALRARLAGSGR